MENKNYYAIIPANVRYDKELSANAKLLYGEITALCNQDGRCWATNSYFAELYGVSIVSVSKWINLLIEKGYVFSEIEYKEGTKQIINRYIYLTKPIKENFNTYQTFLNYPIKEKFNSPIKEKFKDNNTSINNTINKKEKNIKKEKEIDYVSLLKFFNDTYRKNTRIVSDKAKSNLKQRLREGYTKQDVRNVIVNASQDSYHIENGFKYITLEFLFRADKFERYTNLLTKQDFSQNNMAGDLKRIHQSGKFHNY